MPIVLMRVETRNANPSEPPAMFVSVAEIDGDGGSVVAAATAMALASVPAVPLENHLRKYKVMMVTVGAMRNCATKTKTMCVALTGLRNVDAHSRIGTDSPTRKKRMPTTERMTVFDGMTIGSK